MPQNISDCDLHVNGHFSAVSMKLPDGTVTNAMVNGSAAIDATKIIQRVRKTWSQPSGSAGSTETRVIHVARAAGTLRTLRVGSVTACGGAATITFDLKKNGSSVLSGGPVILDSSRVAYQEVSATFASTAYVEGDVFELVVVATAGGGSLGNGPYAELTMDEAPQ